ncbi:MAG: hypothetical protein ACOX89_01455 [Lutispora sp.]
MDSEMDKITKKTNFVGLVFTFFMFLIIIGGYFLEYRLGTRGIEAILFLTAVLIVIYASAIFIYIKNKKSRTIRYIVVLGFLIPYSYTILITESLVAFAFILPIFVIAFIFFERRLLSILTAMVLLTSIFYIRRMMGLGLYSNNSGDFILTVCILTVFLVASAFVGYFNEKIMNSINIMLRNEISNNEKREFIIKEIENFSLTLVSAAEELTAENEESASIAEQISKTIEEIAIATSNQAKEAARGADCMV